MLEHSNTSLFQLRTSLTISYLLRKKHKKLVAEQQHLLEEQQHLLEALEKTLTVTYLLLEESQKEL